MLERIAGQKHEPRKHLNREHDDRESHPKRRFTFNSAHALDADSHTDVSNRNAASPTLTGFEAEEAKEIAVPPHERVGLHNRQELAPVDELRE